MQGLDFRKKRRRSSPKSGRWRTKKGKGSLRFANEKSRLRFAGDQREKERISPKSAVIWAVELLIVCMAAVFLVAAFGQRVSIVGDSMSPSLRNGDVALLNRLVYTVKSPSRGDIVAIKQTGDSHYIVKRIVGLPGETIQISDGRIMVDGKELAGDEYPEGITYAGLAGEPVELGKDEYFVIGDNHTASNDSRTSEVGNISRDDIYGTIWLVVSPFSHFGGI